VQSLVEAARRGKSKDVQKLLGESVDPDGKGQGGVTPLMAAAQFVSVPSVEALIGAGADPNIGKDGTTPMTIAFQQGHKEVLNVLFKSTFSNLDHMVAPPPAASAGGRSEMNGYPEPAGDEVPASAILDLREVTAKLSDVGKPRPRSAVVAAQSPTGNDAPPDENSEDQQAHEGKVREDAMKDAMKLIARQK
jgi:ankyrin repeat protein